MGWERLPILSSFEKARRRESYRKFARAVRRGQEKELLSLDEVRRRLRLFDQHYVGIEPIPVASIVGTVERTGDFDRDFLPRKFETRERWRGVEQAFPHGDFPPIVVYKVGDAYFVVDGHHRVAVAKQREIEFIDAEITELKSRHPLAPDADIARIIHAEQERIFMEESGLEGARPDAHIEFSRPHGYVELLELVKVHGYHLMRQRQEVLTPEQVAEDWYENVFLPGIDVIEAEEMPEGFPNATRADLFLWIHQRRLALLPERGGVTFEDATKHVREERKKPRGEGKRGR